jgi:predicted DCC family thiol-disulfide oxidoreductase YuxK
VTRLFYDGGCGLCHRAVRFVLRRDRRGCIRVAPLGGSTFERLIPEATRIGLPDSLVVRTVEGGCLVRSKALLHLLERMDPPWPGVGTLLAWIPTRLLDGLYDCVARLRPTRRACARDASLPAERFDP